MGKGRRLPSPAMGVAFVALLAALTGTAVALPGNNSVTSGDIRNGQVKTQDIRNNNIRGKDIRNSTILGKDVRNNSITGSDVRESSLSTVPSASTAGAASFAGFAANAGNAAAVGGYRRVMVPAFSLTDGQRRQLLQAGPFTFTADCEINDGGGTDTAAILIATSQNNQAFDADSSDSDFDIADSPTKFAGDNDATGTPIHSQKSDGVAVASNGLQVQADALWMGANLFGSTGTCHFGGYFEIG